MPTKKNSKRTNKEYTLKGRTKSSLKGPAASVRQRLNTLNSNNLYEAVQVPKEAVERAISMVRDSNPELEEAEVRKAAKIEAVHEWVASNTVDFFDAISITYGKVSHKHEEAFSNPGEGFPDGYKYVFAGEYKNGPSYVHDVMAWVDAQIEDPEVFPEHEGDAWPDDFDEIMAVIHKRLLRVYAIIFVGCTGYMKEQGILQETIETFKHHYFFIRVFELVQNAKEFDAFTCKKIKSSFSIKAMEKEYQASKSDYFAARKAAAKAKKAAKKK